MQQSLHFLALSIETPAYLLDKKFWSTQWYPMLLQLDEVPHLFGEKDFQREWEAKEGEKLSIPFWKRVMSLIENDYQDRSVCSR